MAARRAQRPLVENVLPRYCGENVRNDFWCDLVDERYEKPEDSLAKATRKR